jgi:Saxitoxin biosynthesis operon protein SxtJ
VRWSDIPFRPTTATLRRFAGLGVLLLAVLAGWQAFHQGNTALALVLGGVAVALAAFGVVAPGWLRPVFVGLLVLSFPLSWLVTHLVLAGLFYGVFTPLGLCFRLLGRDPLGLRPPQGEDTYWAPKPGAADVRSYFRQS